MPDPFSAGFGLSFEEAVAFAERRGITLPDEYYNELTGQARRMATTVSGMAGLDQIERVIASLTEAFARGQTLREWQQWALLQEWALPKPRLETIFRTNIQTAYSAGHWRSFLQQQDRRPYLMWSAINDARVRPNHLAMDGVIAPVGAPIWHLWHVPAGFSCRCSQISLSHEQAIARGYDPNRPLPSVQPDAGFANAGPLAAEDTLAQLAADKSATATGANAAALRAFLDRWL